MSTEVTCKISLEQHGREVPPSSISRSDALARGSLRSQCLLIFTNTDCSIYPFDQANEDKPRSEPPFHFSTFSEDEGILGLTTGMLVGGGFEYFNDSGGFRNPWTWSAEAWCLDRTKLCCGNKPSGLPQAS
ncbi:hypothetical protein A4X13_0g7028 [Tilletia indica]|uniref:Uncharacterized protein n=1 Tax=Tilletia indica TaxID=43049 RepID=A0A8T8SKX3_9BASI|nr:hypothetical protein A4X13_0g7028 [Tilletia indica]